MKQRLLLSLCAILCSVATWAVTFSSGQFKYSASGSTAEVKNYISGYNSAQVKNLVIPATVTYNGTTYNVTKISGLGGTSGASQYVETVRVEYGGHLVTIAKEAFMGCSKLTKVELTSGVSQILADAFKNCPKLTQFFVCHKTALTGSAAIFNKNVNVYVPYTADLAAHKASTVFSTNATVQQSIVPYDFKAGGCMVVVTDDFYRYVAVTGRVATTSTDWTIPEKLTYNNESWTVKSIAPHANNVADSNLKTLKVSNAINSIGESAFMGNKALTSVSITGVVNKVDNTAFKNCSALTTATMTGVKQLGVEVFSGCTALKTVTFAGHLTTADGSSFAGATNLETITVNNNSTFQTNNGWLYSSSGKTLEFCPPANTKNGWLETVTNIGQAAFANTKQTDITIPYGVKTVNARAFAGSTSIKNVVIPSTVTSWETTEAFKGCTALTTVVCNMKTMPKSYDNTFTGSNYKNATLLVRYYMLDNHYKKDTYWKQFKNFYERAYDFLVDKIGFSLYSDGTAEASLLMTATIPASVNDMFGHSHDVVSIGRNAGEDMVTINGTLTGPNIEEVGNEAFKNCKNLTGVKLPKVKEIKNSAFEGCESLSSVELPLKMNRAGIGQCCFKDCKSLKTIRWPLGIEEVDDQVFMNSGLTSFEVPYDGATKIMYEAFKNCKSLKSVLLPSTVTFVDSDAFEDCSALTNLVVNGLPRLAYRDDDMNVYGIFGTTTTAIFWQNVNSSKCYVRVPVGQVGTAQNRSDYKNQLKTDHITAGGFDFATQSEFGLTVTSLPSGSANGTATAVYLPHLGGNKVVNVTGTFTDAWGRKFDVTAIGDSLFAGSNVEEVTLPSNVTKLPSHCFAYCTSYNPKTLPARITELGDGVFEGCTGLTEMTLSSKVTKIGDRVFAGCKSMARVELSPSLTRVGTETFAGCENLGTVRIPWGVTSLGAGLFSGCTNLGQIYIPSSVTSIGVDKKKDGMIDGCKNLRKVVMNVKTPLALSADAHYSDAIANFEFFVPKGSVTAYQTFFEKTNIYASQIKAGAYDVNRAYSNNVLECFDVKSFDKTTQKGEVVWTQDQFLSPTAEFAIDGTKPCEDDWGRKFNITEIAADAFADGNGRLYDIKLGTINKIGMRAFKNVTLVKDAQKFDFTRQDNTELEICQDAFRDVNSPSGYISIIFDGPKASDYLPNLKLQNGWFGRYSTDMAIMRAYVPKEQYGPVGGQIVYNGNMASTIGQMEGMSLIYHPADKSRDMVVETFPANVSLAGTGLEGVIVTYDDETGKLHEYIVDAIPSHTPFILRLKDGETWQDRYLLDHTDQLPLISGTPYGQKSIDNGGVPSTASQPGYDIYVYNPTLNKLVNASSDEAQGITDGYYVELPSSSTGSANTIDIEEENLTAIGGVTTIRKADTRMFNLGGQRVDRPTKKGLYIVGGRKVIVK